MDIYNRLSAAVDAFRDPGKRAASPTLTMNVSTDQLEGVIEPRMAEAFRKMDLPDDVQKSSSALDLETSKDISDTVTEELPDVPEGALIQRIVIDAPNESAVYYYPPDDARTCDGPGPKET